MPRWPSPERDTAPDPGSSEEEEWRGLNGSYSVSSLGRVRNDATGYVLKGSVNAYGYRHVRIEGIHRTVHLLVAEAFHGPRTLGWETRHLDGDKLNNRADNLKYGTRSENQQDRKAHGTYQYGERAPGSRLTVPLVKEIIDLNRNGLGYKKLSKRFGVSASCIQKVCVGRTWVEATRSFDESVS